MAAFSTYEALNTLYTSIPEWTERLDKLNGQIALRQIALRQIELARLTESEHPPTRSIKNKGSTESLRPNDAGDNPFVSSENENPDDPATNPFDTPNLNACSLRPNYSATQARVVAASPTSGGLARQPSHPIQATAGKAAARKRKTESLASGESIAPKYRTRSMIIVYYDDRVQQAFEELVKFVSGSRNAMRKGKMSAKVEEMKRAAELELEADEEDEDDTDGAELGGLVTNSGDLLSPHMNAPIPKAGSRSPNFGIGTAVLIPDSTNEAELNMPKLQFVSTRQIGPSRSDPKAESSINTLSFSMLRGYRRSGGGGSSDLFDAIDKGLEWVQRQCEHAAHQFLRDGDCSTEIANIKCRLAEVKDTAGKEVEKLRARGADKPPPSEERQLKRPLRRREVKLPKAPEVDDGMVVDEDEGVDDLEPPKLVFKRSRDVGR